MDLDQLKLMIKADAGAGAAAGGATAPAAAAGGGSAGMVAGLGGAGMDLTVVQAQLNHMKEDINKLKGAGGGAPGAGAAAPAAGGGGGGGAKNGSFASARDLEALKAALAGKADADEQQAMGQELERLAGDVNMLSAALDARAGVDRSKNDVWPEGRDVQVNTRACGRRRKIFCKVDDLLRCTLSWRWETSELLLLK